MSYPQRRVQCADGDAALPIVERLRQTIEAENRDIELGRPVKHEAYSLRKNQGLLELNRLAPTLGRAAAASPLHEALADLHAKLEINRRALALQLKACVAVSEIIARAIRDSQSDGTYTALAWRRSPE
jgi:class 3 adenylate cyclase